MFKKYILPTLLIVILSMVSCKDFLTEDFRSGENSQSIVSSEETFETLINAAYASLRAWYGKENGWDLTEAGTDLYTYGLDNRSIGFCIYSTFTGAEEQARMGAMWRELYKAINTCNLGIREIPEVPYSDEITRAQRLGELKYLRAHYYWLIVEVWGGVHFTTEPSESVEKTANRTSVDEFYAQIFSDLREARAVLPDVQFGADYGRASKAACEAMLARTHLYRQNYDSAAYYANSVINNYGFQLLDDWSQIWNLDNILNDEVIWAVNYSDDPIFTNPTFTDINGDVYTNEGLIQRDGGNNGHLMWEVRYENLSWGMIRDIENGRGFQRWCPTKFFIDLYDESIDERFFGSFKNVWLCNSEDVPRWLPFIFVDGERIQLPMELWAQDMFEIGDTAIYFSKQPVPQTEKGKFRPTDLFYIDPESGFIIIDINDMYLEDGSINEDIINRQFYFPITKKYEDPTRLEISTQFSKRDVFVFRISEMYLIAAEAALMNGNAGMAAQYLNTLREARSVEGREDEMMITAGDVDIDFILDERARELATEFQRYFDLKRTGKLVERVRTHNPDAQAIMDFHALRFIPQSQLDAMTNSDGYQNPGY